MQRAPFCSPAGWKPRRLALFDWINAKYKVTATIKCILGFGPPYFCLHSTCGDRCLLWGLTHTRHSQPKNCPLYAVEDELTTTQGSPATNVSSPSPSSQPVATNDRPLPSPGSNPISFSPNYTSSDWLPKGLLSAWLPEWMRPWLANGLASGSH